MDRAISWAIVHGVTKVGHDLATERQKQYSRQLQINPECLLSLSICKLLDLMCYIFKCCHYIFKGYYKIFSEIFQSIKVRKEIFIKVNIAIKTITILKVYSIPKITRVLKT